MATLTKTFTFAADAESWLLTTGGATGLTGGQTGAPDGVIWAWRQGKNLTNGTPYYEWSGTWEDLGLPVGGVVSDVKLDYEWRCTLYTTGAATSSHGPAELRDSAGTLRGTFLASATFGGTSAFATRTGSTLSSLTDASSTSIKLRIGTKPDTGNSNSASVSVDVGTVTVTVTYTVPVIPDLVMAPPRAG